MKLPASKPLLVFFLCYHVVLFLAFSVFLANQILSVNSISLFLSVFTFVFSSLATFPLQTLGLIIGLHIPSVVTIIILRLIISKLLRINGMKELSDTKEPARSVQSVQSVQ